MKKYTSVFGMIVRHSFFQILTIIIGMVLVEIYLFLNAVNKMLTQKGVCVGTDSDLELFSFTSTEETQEMLLEFQEYPIINLELAVENSHMVWIFLIAMAFVTISCCMTGCHFGSHQGYTLQRLQIKEKQIVCLQAVYNILCYLLLWCVQMIVVYALCSYYKNHAIGTTNQTIVFAFYRNNFLHNLFPMEEWLKWGKLIIGIFGLGILSAIFPYKQRMGKFGIEVILLFAVISIFFSSDMGNYYIDAIVIEFVIGIVIIVCRQLYSREKKLKNESSI